jgi:hypothetical protein
MMDQATHSVRFRIGVALFIAGLLSPLLVPVVNALDLSTEWRATLSGLLLLGIPALLWLIAAAVMGKRGFDHLKSKAFGLLRRCVLPDSVGRVRYRIGLVMFAVPLLSGWLAPYAEHLTPGLAIRGLGWSLGGDVLLLASLFVLGGDFWEKLRSLFTYDAGAQPPELGIRHRIVHCRRVVERAPPERRGGKGQHDRLGPVRALHATLTGVLFPLDGDPPARVVRVEDARELADRPLVGDHGPHG